MTLPISPINSIPIPNAAAATASSGSNAFSNLLQNTISNMQSLQNNASTSARQFMTGENEELHSVALAGQQAELAFELGLQVRNKVVSAYQEVMKMQL